MTALHLLRTPTPTHTNTRIHTPTCHHPLHSNVNYDLRVSIAGCTAALVLAVTIRVYTRQIHQLEPLQLRLTDRAASCLLLWARSTFFLQPPRWLL